MRSLLERLGLVAAGGNYDNLRNKLQKLNVDCSHWTGRAWNRGQRLKDWSVYKTTAHTKKHLVIKRGHKCEYCGLERWKNLPINLELHHLDGDRTNNKEDNFQLLCPNCHSYTKNFRRAKNAALIKVVPICLCPCGGPKYKRAKQCRSCADKNRVHSARKAWPAKDDLERMILEAPSISSVAEELGVSRTAIRVRLKKNGILLTPREHPDTL